ncbi:MAG TPA: O-antigen ligase family protein [Stellaceae bacterium]|nr:O-antigen ligase family protein [Stellaceae bacterium]
MLDKFAIVPVLACIFALIVSPLLGLFNTTDEQAMLTGRAASLDNRIFWPAMTAISILLAVQNGSRLSKRTWPPHIICLLAYLSFAGASVLWAFSPESSFVRFVQQAMIVTSIVLPAMMAARTADMMRGLFLCFAFALILNVFFVLDGSVDTGNCNINQFCYEGYFEGKNYLGECAAAAFLLSLHEIAHRGWRRASGIIVAAIAIILVFMSDSKTAFGLVIISPLLALLTLMVRKLTRISPAIILLFLPLSYIIISRVSHIDFMARMAYILYHDSTLTGRTIIWEFAQYEIGRRPLLGWGYQSFWLVPGSPSLEAPGWVKMMPNAHNGYYDTTLEMGYVGLTLLYIFIIATLHAVGRVADRDPARARLLLSLALFFIMWNYFESLWMRGFEFLWIVFLIVAAEIGRYWQPFPLRRAFYQPFGKVGFR